MGGTSIGCLSNFSFETFGIDPADPPAKACIPFRFPGWVRSPHRYSERTGASFLDLKPENQVGEHQPGRGFEDECRGGHKLIRVLPG